MAAGHRERLRERFATQNIEDIPEYVVLEMFLTGVVRQRDTCEIARELIKTFGSLAKVIDAPETELLKIEGMGKTMASYIKLLPLFYRKYAQSKWEDANQRLDSTQRLGTFCVNRFIGYKTEALMIICMDSNFKVLAVQTLAEGDVDSVAVSTRTVIDTALKYNASRVALTHNHLSGIILPSVADVDSTKALKAALSVVDIELDDHIIVANDEYISLLEGKYCMDL